MPDRVQIAANERVDNDDRNRVGEFADVGARSLGRVLGQPLADPADGAYCVGCVLTPASIAFGVPGAADITIGAGLRIMCATPLSALAGVLSGDGPPNGDIMTLAANAAIIGGMPSAPIPLRWVLARSPLLASTDNALRIFWQAAAPYEVAANQDTNWRRTLAAGCFLVVNSLALAEAEVPNGYQIVAKIGWHGGAPAIDQWYGAYGDIANVADYPQGYIESDVQAHAAAKTELSRIKGGAWGWDGATPTGTHSLTALATRALVLEAQTLALEAQTLALEAQTLALEARTLVLEAQTIRTAVRFRGDGAGGLVIVDSLNVAGIAILGVGQYQITRTIAVAGKYHSASCQQFLGFAAVATILNVDATDIYIRTYDVNAGAVFDVTAIVTNMVTVLEFG